MGRFALLAQRRLARPVRRRGSRSLEAKMADADVHIRRGIPTDAEQLAEFGARVFKETFGPDNTDEDMAAYLSSTYSVPQQTAELQSQDIATLLVEKGGLLVAFAQVRRQSPPDCMTEESSVELWRFYVDEPWKGRGVAQVLMDAVHEAAHELGGRTLWLSVWERNASAIAFYRRCGFRDFGTKDF
jgi:ribosomal protein S18 acetylase RimI-like enzyme